MTLRRDETRNLSLAALYCEQQRQKMFGRLVAEVIHADHRKSVAEADRTAERYACLVQSRLDSLTNDRRA